MNRINAEHISLVGTYRENEKTVRKPGVRDPYFDNIKGVLIMLVVIGHFLLPMSFTRLVWALFFWIYLFHMPMFVMISGYFAKGVWRDGQFQGRKVLQLLWLYLLFKLAVHIPENLAAGTPITQPINFFYEGGAPWYLLAMVWWYLSVPFLTKMKPWLVMITAVAISLVFGYQLVIDSNLALDRTFAFLPFFYCGYYLKEEWVRRYRKRCKRWLFAAEAVILSIALVLGNQDMWGRYQAIVYGMDYRNLLPELIPWGGVIRGVQYVLAVIMVLGTMAVIPRKETILTGIGKRTMQIYILHRLLRDMLQYWGFYTVFTSQYRKNVVFVIVLAVVVTFALGNSWIAKGFQLLQHVPDYCLARWRQNN